MRELRELVARARTLTASGAPAALATIVHVDGSSYRREGARMLLEPDGSATGVLSGGCVERELVPVAAEVMASGHARTVTFDLTAENEAIWGTGSGCQGRVTLLVEPLFAAGSRTTFAVLGEALDERREARIATVYGCSTDLIALGERLKEEEVEEEEDKENKEKKKGFIEGKDLNGWRRVAGALLSDLSPGVARSARVNVGEGGDASGGSVELLLESIVAPVRLVVIGGERDLVPLVRLGVELGWEVVVVDSRAGAGVAERFAGLAPLVVAAPRALGAGGGGGDPRLALDARTAVVVATHRYLDDLAWLGALAAIEPARRTGNNRAPRASRSMEGDRDGGTVAASEAQRGGSSFSPSMKAFGYFGLLGPERRRERLLADLSRQGIALDRARLHGPAGLALGGRAPEEVALAIVAEIQAALSGGSGGALSVVSEG